MSLIFFIHAIYAIPALAQTPKLYIVKAGESPATALPTEAKYVFPVFTNGTVFIRDGTSSNQKLNYNYLSDEMQFIGSKGDTLSIAEPFMIANIVIDTTIYYYEKFYLKEVFRAGTYTLAIRQMLVQTSEKKYAGFGQPSGTSSTSSYATINTNSSNYRLQAKKDVYMEMKVFYYIGVQFNHFVKADKKGFREAFSKKEDLQQYINDNQINYNNQDDLQKLLQFCTK